MIDFTNVHKWLMGQHILKGVDFHVERGETLVIVGPTGSGKSLTLRHMIGLHLPDAGTVRINGKSTSDLNGGELESFRNQFGFLFQSGALLNWMTVADNVALPLKEKTKLDKGTIYQKVEETLARLGLEDAGGKMPAEISGGMRKRTALARAIITEPSIILYDEPTSGLDPVMARRIDHMIEKLRRDSHVTSVVVTHDLVSAFGIGDRIAMLHEGRMVECGTPEQFQNSGNHLVQEFIDAQLKIAVRELDVDTLHDLK